MLICDRSHHDPGGPRALQKPPLGWLRVGALLPARGARPGCSGPRAPALLPSACGRWEGKETLITATHQGRDPLTWEQRPRGAWDQRCAAKAVLAAPGLPRLPAAQHCAGAF